MEELRRVCNVVYFALLATVMICSIIFVYRTLSVGLRSKSSASKEYICMTMAGFESSHVETKTSLNPGIGFASSGKSAVGIIPTNNTVTVPDYYIVCTINNKSYYLLTLDQYDLYVLVKNLDTFKITEKEGLTGIYYTIKGKEIKIKSLTQDEAEAYQKAFDEKR